MRTYRHKFVLGLFVLAWPLLAAPDLWASPLKVNQTVTTIYHGRASIKAELSNKIATFEEKLRLAKIEMQVLKRRVGVDSSAYTKQVNNVNDLESKLAELKDMLGRVDQVFAKEKFEASPSTHEVEYKASESPPPTSITAHVLDEMNFIGRLSYIGETNFDDSLKNKYAGLDQNKALNLSGESIEMVLQLKRDHSERGSQDRQAVIDALYSGEEFRDIQGYRVRLSKVVQRPEPASLNRIYFSDRQDGPDFGLSIVSRYQVFNRALPENWGLVVERSLNDAANLGGGSPEYYMLTDQLGFRSPDSACNLCITQRFGAPQFLSGQWRQPHSEQYVVQGVDRGYQNLDALGARMTGSDEIAVQFTLAETVSTARYFNLNTGLEMFTLTLYFPDLKAGGKVALGAGATSWQGLMVRSDANVQIMVSSPHFPSDKRINVLIRPANYLSLF